MNVITPPEFSIRAAHRRKDFASVLRIYLFAMFLLAACQPLGRDTRLPPTLPESLSLAWDVLISVFDDVHAGRYQAVAKGLGELPPDLAATLMAKDPDWQADLLDKAAVVEKACTMGYLCLPIWRVVAVEPVSETEYEFLVEFSGEDGDVFVLEPCCGGSETEMPPQSVFQYRVIRDAAGQWRVNWAPIYLP